MTSAEMVKYFYEVVLSGNQLDRIPDFIAPDCLLRTAETLAPLGAEGMREHIRATSSMEWLTMITVTPPRAW